MKFEDITIAKTITRKTDRLYREAMLEGAGVDENQEFDIPMKNIMQAQNVLVRELTGLTDDQVDALDSAVFNEVIDEIQKIPSNPMTALSQN